MGLVLLGLQNSGEFLIIVLAAKADSSMMDFPTGGMLVPQQVQK